MKGLIFTNLLAFGGSGIAIFRPFVGLCIYYCFAVLRPQALWFFSVPQDVNYSRYVAIATLLGWGFNGFPMGESLKGKFTIPLALSCLVLDFQLCSWNALDSTISEPVATDLLKVFLMFLVVFFLLDSTSRLQALCWVYIISQGYLAYDLNMAYFLSGVNLVFSNDGYGGLNNNTFALSLLPGLAVALATGIYERRLFLRCVALLSSLLSIHLLLLSQSRGAYLGGLAIGFIVAFIVLKSRKNIFVIALVALMTSFLIGESVRKEFATMFADKLDYSAVSRFDLWAAGFRVMMDYP